MPDKREVYLLQKGLKYNLHPKPKYWLKTLSIEADQDAIRYLVAQDLDKLHRNSKAKPPHGTWAHIERKTLNRIETKLIDNDAIITKADKRQTLIIIKKADYDSKVREFLINNKCQKIVKDPTSRFQRKVRKSIKTYSITIRPSEDGNVQI
jgi:hypothetical protein